MEAVAEASAPAVHSKHASTISKADLYCLAGTVAIEVRFLTPHRRCLHRFPHFASHLSDCSAQVCGGPPIAFKTGRQDFTMDEAVARNGPSGCPFGDGAHNPNGSRLPAADIGPAADAPRGCPMHVKEKPTIDAIRGTFTRLGFDAKATVCLIILGHQFGRCHLDVSGNQFPWYAFDPAHWNVYGPGGLGYLSLYRMGVHRMREVKNTGNLSTYPLEPTYPSSGRFQVW